MKRAAAYFTVLRLAAAEAGGVTVAAETPAWGMAITAAATNSNAPHIDRRLNITLSSVLARHST